MEPIVVDIVFYGSTVNVAPFLLMAISFNQVALCTYPAYHVRTLLVVSLPYPALHTGLLSDNIFETLITWKVMRVSMMRLIKVTIVILEMMNFFDQKTEDFHNVGL